MIALSKSTSIRDYPTSARILSKADFDRVFRSKASSARARGMLALYLPNQHQTARLGMTVARKNLGNAVRRNRIRRQLREVFRQVRPDLPNVDIVVIIRKDFRGIPEQQWFDLCQQLFQRILPRPCQVSSNSG